MVTGEVWKPVVGYEGIYEVSSLGNLRNASGKRLSVFPNQAGYYRVNLCYHGKRRAKFIHRIVAEAFLENPLDYSQVNHKDENKRNNSVDNLEWCNAEYNTNYGSRNQRVAEIMRMRNNRSIVAVDPKSNEETIFPSITFASAIIGKQKSYICYAIKHPQKAYSGYKWRYADDNWQRGFANSHA